MQIDMEQFLDSFFDEASEHVETMEAGLLQLESEPTDQEMLNTVFRAAHSIKGAATTFGVSAVGEFTHILENLLDRMRDRELPVTSEATGILLLAVDVLSGLLTAARSGGPGPDNITEVVAQLQGLQGGAAEAVSASAADSSQGTDTGNVDRELRIVFHPSEPFFHFGLDPLLLLRDLEELGTILTAQLNAEKLPSLAELDPETCFLSWEVTLKTTRPDSDVADVFLFIDDDSRLEISTSEPAVEASPSEEAAADESVGKASEPAARSQTSTARESVRVNGERLDEMINQIGELVIGISMVEQEWEAHHSNTESSAITQLSKIVRDLQEQSLSLRMVPVAATFQKLARVVRDLSNRLGKKIHFEVHGEETELDKTVVDRIGDPLVHMIRNSADHGIETPEERLAAGKPEEGRVTVSAYHQGGNIYIELKDDGRGLNAEAIRRKAEERGVIRPDDRLSHNEICDLIFHPGLSTAEEVTDVSGRGVGMDVVRRNIEELKGSITLQSVPDEGTTVLVRLPLTLAILDGLLVKLASEVYVIPMLSVIESFRPRENDIRRLANDMEVVQVRGDVVPVIRLHRILRAENAVTDAGEGLLVIVEDHDHKFALLVDDLLGQQQAVIKNLEDNFRKVPGIAGATILGDGRVALIIDIVGLRTLAAPQALSVE